jgi:polyvinyl alcohol dehydrogenase (cytochrome)
MTAMMKTRGVLRTFAVTIGMAATMLPAQGLFDWPNFGQNAANSGSTFFGPSPSDAANLKLKWTFNTTNSTSTADGSVSARASVVNGVAYFPDWAGNLWAVNTTTGKAIWGVQISSYLGMKPGTVVSRATPAYANGILYVATQTGAYMLAVDAASGKLRWKTQLESADPFAIISASPVVQFGIVYTGVASVAEGGTLYGDLNIAGTTTAPSPARGSVVAVDAFFGNILWKTYTVPTGYTGGGVWGSNLVVDLLRGLVYAGTGDNYSVPTDPTYVACYNAGIKANGATPNTAAAACISPNDHSDSIVAFNMFTGQVKWATRLMNWNQQATEGVQNGTDFWNVDCDWASLHIPGGTPNGPQCPAIAGPDYDFGSAPNEIVYLDGWEIKTLIGAGQKSGIYYALNPDTGALVWQNQVGPGSSLGGMEWGSATDGQRIYVAISDLYAIPYGTKGSIHAGSWSALDPATGKILWQVADPNGAIDLSPMAVANGVVYAGSMAGSPTAPTMFALNAATGKVIWQYASGGSVISGATIVGDMVYWGSGYLHLPIPGFGGNNKFYAFSVNGQ